MPKQLKYCGEQVGEGLNGYCGKEAEHSGGCIFVSLELFLELTEPIP